MAFLRGARPSPKHKLLAASPYRVTSVPLPQFAVVPTGLQYYGNNQYGDCVSAEEGFAKLYWSTYCNVSPVTAPTDAEVISFARQNGFLNGADLTEVMDAMISRGMSVGGTVYKDGGYQGVDYSNELVLQSALDPTDGSGGPVKIAIDASALPSGAGNQNGWFSTSGAHYGNTDHCVGLAGYGRADYLYDMLKVSLPSGLSASTPGYLLFTWSTLGFVTHDWLMGTCTESWVRNPTTAGQSPPAPTPPPSPPSPPSPPTPAPVNLVFKGDPVHIPLYGLYTPTGSIGQGTMHAAPGAINFNWLQLPVDAWHAYSAILAQDAAGLLQAVDGIIADVGLTVPQPHLQKMQASAINWGPVLLDVVTLMAAIAAKDPAAVMAGVMKLIADLGVSIP